MNTEIINPFLKATKQVVEMMAQIEVVAETPSIKKDNKTWGVVSGLVGLAGEQLSGNMVLSFDEPSIVAIVNAMIGESFSSLNEQVTDAVGELTNMISGTAKRELSERGFQFEMAIPVTIVGQHVEIVQLAQAPIVSIPFKTSMGQFVVEASLGKKK